ncbi:MAG: 3-hydroxyacyl-CoA dehydrogenase [Geminicoccaceae bacterium]|nr:3-hydroxyacyl-CoA dehydrogenase [Geminicoccaceae bacterium]
MVRPLAPEAAVGIVGAGTMGAGIAQVALQAGHPVILVDRDPAIVERARAGIEARLRRLVDKGRLAGDAACDALARLRPAATAADLAGCALVVEAVIEELATKRALFAEVERHVTDDAILASNTSSIPITAIAAGLRRPERFLGMHFFNPAPVMKLVEVISGLLTGADVAETVVATAVAWGKVAARARSTPGFIVNRVARPFYGEALRLLAEGAADAATIDAILRDCGGFRMGPFELTDLIGQDVNAAVTRSVHDAMFQDPRYRPSLLQEEMVEAGRLGRKSGIGFFDYREGAVPAVAAEEPSASMPGSIVVEGDPGPLAPLVLAALEAGVTVERDALGRGVISIAGAQLAMSDGRPAAERALEDDMPTALVDLCLDFAATPRLAVAFSPDMDDARRDAIAGFLQIGGRRVSVVRDLPGLVVLRTVAMLANEAADAVHFGVAAADDIDAAMVAGVNYPQGPLALAKSVGLSRIAGTIGHLGRIYGEDRYRLSPELHRARLARALDVRSAETGPR